MSTILVTGAAGFIGYHICRRLLADGETVVGVDSLTPYYDPKLKQSRLEQLAAEEGWRERFQFEELDLASRSGVDGLFRARRFDTVVHLAAQAGVRHSALDPASYIDSNLVGFANVLEGCRQTGVGHLVFASSSSVYGANPKIPFSTRDPVDHPLSLYGATKRAGELLAHSYAAMHGLPCTGLRFFTVYGPWGRPDMAVFLFTKAILERRPIDLYNGGRNLRDFTYVDDVVEAMVRLIHRVPLESPATPHEPLYPAISPAPFRVYNVGNRQPVEMSRLVELLEHELALPALKNPLPPIPGDPPVTYADSTDLEQTIGFSPNTPIQHGVARFVEWYRSFYQA